MKIPRRMQVGGGFGLPEMPDALIGKVSVFLDGTELHRVNACDADAGWASILLVDMKGEHYPTGDGQDVASAIVRGKIELRPR